MEETVEVKKGEWESNKLRIFNLLKENKLRNLIVSFGKLLNTKELKPFFFFETKF